MGLVVDLVGFVCGNGEGEGGGGVGRWGRW